jgi:hypothetical protein
MTITNFPMVSQRSTVTSDGRPSENALYDCVPASIGAIMLWLSGKSAWDDAINPDKLKDAAYGESYTGGTSASNYVAICKAMGFTLASIDTTDPGSTIALARQLLLQQKPVIFTELDPYVDTSLPQYSGWTHVCAWFAGDGAGLTAMDPFIAQPVYKSDGTWASLLRANQVWTVERIPMSTVPQGWSDDGTTLRAPNNVPVVLGFRAYVLSHAWEQDNWPLSPEAGMAKLEASNPSLGGGTQQLFKKSMLGYTDHVFEEYVGVELDYLRKYAMSLYTEYQKLKAGQVPDPRVADYTNRLGQIRTLSSL